MGVFISTIWTNIKKHKLKSLFAALISLLIILFLFVYLGGLYASTNQLENLSETLPVEGVISDISGSNTTDLFIGPSKVQKLEETGLLRDVVKIKVDHVDGHPDGYTAEEIKKMHFTDLLFSVNTMEAFPYIPENSVQLAEGADKDFLSGDDNVCILEKSYMQLLELKVGDTYQTSLYRRKYDDWLMYYEMVYGASAKMKIIGTFEVDASLLSGSTYPSVIAPLKYVREAYRETEEPYRLTSMSFKLKNALDMNKFKAQAAEIGFEERNAEVGFDISGKAIILYDEAFIKTATQLKENISMMRLFAPLVFLVVAFIGFLSSYLLMQSRQNEFAIMRSLGTTKIYCFFTILIESAILCLAGGALGAAAGIIFINISPLSGLIILGIFTSLYLLGTAVAVILLNRFSVMEILVKRDE